MNHFKISCCEVLVYRRSRDEVVCATALLPDPILRLSVEQGPQHIPDYVTAAKSELVAG